MVAEVADAAELAVDGCKDEPEDEEARQLSSPAALDGDETSVPHLEKQSGDERTHVHGARQIEAFVPHFRHALHLCEFFLRC